MQDSLSPASGDALGQVVFQESSDACFLFDSKSKHLLDANSAAQRLSGFGMAALCSLNVTDLLSAVKNSDLQRLTDAFANASNFHAHDGFLLQPQTGPPLPVDLSVRHVQAGPPSYTLIVVRQTRAHAGTNQQALAGREATGMDQNPSSTALQQFAGAIAHDFSNLLGEILVNSRLALDKATASTADAMYLREIIAAAERAAERCQHLEAFLREWRAASGEWGVRSGEWGVGRQGDKETGRQID